MLSHPAEKYRPYPPIALPDRRWPDRQISHAPRWLSTDLRDGNQALAEPMDSARKLQFWDLLLECGFKEIEVAFPSASQTDFNFVRQLIDEQRIPEDVTIQVLTQARDPLILRTFEALRGARRATVHLYNATAPLFRELVFGMDKAEVIALATRATRLIRQQCEQQPETRWQYEYSP
ncbi:TPA: 2-isopropylmalate synthase, partial [Klebsiella pneumoniae]|nr:2-isopropylmalate synthase [Klebsiella pneumoniae]HDZ9280161.1 2-isopropylmalate synthase [Klebsiella pneumoniae]